jgi:hypothetical protein
MFKDNISNSFISMCYFTSVLEQSPLYRVYTGVL